MANSVASPPQSDTLTGKVSWFGGPHDPGALTTYADPRIQGVAIYDSATKGGWWLIQLADGKQAIVKQTDVGPAPWTKRVVDIGASALSALGYTESNFPTNSTVKAVYLGNTIPSDLTMMGVPVIGGSGVGTAAKTTGVKGVGAATSVVDTITSPITSVTDFLSKLWRALTDPHTWLRLAMGVGALLLLYVGLRELSGHGIT